MVLKVELAKSRKELEAEAAARQKESFTMRVGGAPKKEKVSQEGAPRHVSTAAVLGLAGALLALRAAVRRAFFGGGGKDKGKGKGKGKGKTQNGRSAFTFPAPKKKKGAAAAAAAAESTANANLPRNKQGGNNKKNRARKAEKKEKRKSDAIAEAALQVQREKDKAKAERNRIPDAKDVVGGEAGKTFTTYQHTKIAKWVATARNDTATSRGSLG